MNSRHFPGGNMPSSFLNYAHSVLPYITLNSSAFENVNDDKVKY